MIQNKFKLGISDRIVRTPSCFAKKNGGSTALGFVFPNKLGKIPIFTNIFQMGWNHQLDWNDLFSHVVIIVLFAFPMAYQVAYNNLALSLNRGEKVSRMPQ